ncbi:membrane protein [Moniliophthora roreri MCA 2997]|uniref:Membrane protein n=1 Tax=Moniliophthora roreri (strain MCA 2997) TaxID=1381753 RepID=V2XXK4_MONRO|nr:membrane protein [Moniliophthora roreri MCA 2997]
MDFSLIDAALLTRGADFRADDDDDDDDMDDVSYPDSPAGDPSDLPLEKHKLALQTYLNSVPYECESNDVMQAKLEEIVGKIYVCAKTQNWLTLTTWDGMLQCWLLMRYPMEKTVRAKLVRLYYDLCTLPGIDPRVIRSWADMVSRLIANKGGVKRKLESQDLQLPWQPLWRALKKEMWPKKRIEDTSRNVVNILLYVAEQCKFYYAEGEIQNMLDTFLPLLTQDSVLTMVPVLTSFLPPKNFRLYIPPLFKIWEAFNSSVLDDRLLELAGDLSKENLIGRASEGVEWKDVGIWTDSEWNMLVGKGLGSMNVPVGIARGSSTTASHADYMSSKSTRIKKSINRQDALAKILVYSMSVDGTVKDSAASNQGNGVTAYAAGSKAVDSLDRLITSTESFFHPSNHGLWTPALTNFLQRITSEFLFRMKEEEQDSCKIPVTRRLTSTICKTVVSILRTPALLAMFSKDPASMGYAQASLRMMALFEPKMIMPELLERAYDGLEVVNETHRTTAVLGMLSGIVRPLTTEALWLSGQKHVLPLLELCIPGIDVNDPTKTLCAAMFIVGVMQNIRAGDLSIHQSGMPLTDDGIGHMDVDQDSIELPTGTERGMPALSREEERALVRDSTAVFSDWVVSLFRRVLALYENLPEEGGKRNTTGGKIEEGILRSIKNMMDVVCLHLSDQLFDLVLKLVYEYGTTNAKANSVKAFGQLIACLARANPEKTIARFLPFCLSQIEEELKHGASSVRTTSSHVAVASDTTLHWNLSILKGCLGYGGALLLKSRDQIINLILMLVEMTKSERGYSSAGQLITRVLHTLVGVYPLNSRFVNSDEWASSSFEQDHNVFWGKAYKPEDVVVEWHVPTDEEIDFVLEILDQVAGPTLSKVEALLEDTSSWTSVSRNDFCRYLQACRSIWAGLPTFLKEAPKEIPNHRIYEDIESFGLLVPHLDVEAGFTLCNPKDSRYQKAVSHRTRFGEVVQQCAVKLRQKTEGEDHIDAVMTVSKAIDVYLLDYALTKGRFDSLQKSYTTARDMNRSWSRQVENSRLVWVKRAQLYHSGRVYMHSLYRRRSALDDALIVELVELSLSPYTRVRRHAQSVLQNVFGSYVRSTRYALPMLLQALTKGNDPDRMKGALYVLSNKGIASYSLTDQGFHKQYLLSLLGCQHEEKPSIQKLVATTAQECYSHLLEDVVHTDAYTIQLSMIDHSLQELQQVFSSSLVNHSLLQEAISKYPLRIEKRTALYHETVRSILDVASKPKTHWRYIHMSARFLHGMSRRDLACSPECLEFFVKHSTSPQPSIRATSERAIVKLFAFIKYRSYSTDAEQLWREEWKNPLQEDISISDALKYLESYDALHNGVERIYIDKTQTGFLVWKPKLKAYRPITGEKSLEWDTQSQASLERVRTLTTNESYYTQLSVLWSQESSKANSTMELRSDNVLFIKSLAKMLNGDGLNSLLEVIEPLISDSDKYKQRAGGEFLTGILRGSKHWPKSASQKLWEWTTSRLDAVLANIKPDTLLFWETVFGYILEERDPRRNQPLVDWILALPLDFNADSAFAMNKTLTVFLTLVENLGVLFNLVSDKYVNLLFDNANTTYAEIRSHIAQLLYTIMRNQWRPLHPSAEAFVRACHTEADPLRIREVRYQKRMSEFTERLAKSKQERLPPPRVSQSEYDKVGLTLLQWIWVSSHGAQATLVFPYAVSLMPEMIQMSELSDNPELQNYSTAAQYVLSAVTPLAEYIPVILDNFASAIKSSSSWRIRHHTLPAMIVFFYRNLLYIPPEGVSKVMDVLLECLGDENVEVREMASKVLSGVVRCSQRQSIVPLKNRFVRVIKKTNLPGRRDPTYAQAQRSLHSAILGLCALIEAFPYSVEPWMPPLTEVLAPHATDPPPISTTIRKCASEFKKTHQDTWHKDQQAFDEEQLQSLSTMLVGTSYYA